MLAMNGVSISAQLNKRYHPEFEERGVKSVHITYS